MSDDEPLSDEEWCRRDLELQEAIVFRQRQIARDQLRLSEVRLGVARSDEPPSERRVQYHVIALYEKLVADGLTLDEVMAKVPEVMEDYLAQHDLAN
jgi:hypothetical protein